MADEKYIIYGSEYSPFSIKVRSYFRYKGIPHEWRPRTQDNLEHFKAHAKLPLVPLVLCPDGSALQDSTPIMEEMEKRYPDASISLEEEALNFLSFLLEEYADEWGNKPMFHYRWWRDIDQIAVAKGIASGVMPNASREEKEQYAANVRKRMVPRLSFVGSSEQTKEGIEASLDEALELLEDHLSNRSFIFGGRPSFADFGLFCQLYGCTQQPTTQVIIEAYSNVASWIDQMLEPEAEGKFEEWDCLKETLTPFLQKQVGGLYLPWAVANAKALFSEEQRFTVTLKGRDFTQDTIKYTGRSFHILKNRFSKVEDRAQLEEILLSSGCLEPLLKESW
ncbi:MAG: glutathione S-transferase family protein [Sneathiellales bacterium]|nr:glutathione S-transferase family protein [Sneathiellales bacterium]